MLSSPRRLGVETRPIRLGVETKSIRLGVETNPGGSVPPPGVYAYPFIELINTWPAEIWLVDILFTVISDPPGDVGAYGLPLKVIDPYVKARLPAPAFIIPVLVLVMFPFVMFAVVILPVVIAAVAIVAVPDTEALAPVKAPEAVTLPPVITPETEADPDTFNPAPVRVPAVVRFPAVKVPVYVPVFPETALLTTKELPVISPDVIIVATLNPPVPVTLKSPVTLVGPARIDPD